MLSFLIALCGLLAAAVLLLCLYIRSLRKAADDIRTAFAQRLQSDTNVGIDISTGDAAMRRLAADIDRQLSLLRRAHIRYAQGDRELSDAITNIAHDLRTPLTAICGYLELLQQEDASPTVRRYLEIIGGRVDALAQLTGELFRYSVLVCAPPSRAAETVDLAEALETCVAAHYGVLKARGIVPDIRLPEAPVTRSLDPSALFRVLENVLTNAVKYSEGDLRITLSEDAAITIENRAPGLDAVHVGRLFDRFYTVNTGKDGTGLGLSIAKLLMERMGGSIAAALEGGVFSVTLCFPQGDIAQAAANIKSIPS